jgi:hypothetical protein
MIHHQTRNKSRLSRIHHWHPAKKVKNNEFPTNVALAEALRVHADKKLADNPHSHNKQFHYYITHLRGSARVICQEVHSKNIQMLKVSCWREELEVLPQSCS